MEILRITRAIAPLLDDLTNTLFRDYNPHLLTQPLDYIVPAVWGAKLDGTLDDTQQAIHARVKPVVEQVFRTLELTNTRDAQDYAILYLIRGYIISRIIFSIAELRHQIMQRMAHPTPENQAIGRMDPIGNA
jgi:hypothetical protein